MKQISWAKGIECIASLLVFCTFYMKTMLPPRGVAITSNIAFMAYGRHVRRVADPACRG